MIKVSLVVGIYNREHFLKRCVDSLINQTYQNIEIILFNNASTDNSQQIINFYSENYPAIIKICGVSVNIGAGGGRTKGMESATGDYICFIDSDDSIAPDYIESMVEIAISNSSLPDIVITNFSKVDIYDNILYERHYKTSQEALFQSIAPWGKMFLYDYIKKNQLILRNLPFAEDVLFAAELYLTKPVVCLCESKGYLWLDNSTSTSRVAFRGFPKDALPKAFKYFDYMLKRYPNEKKWLEYFLIKYCVWYLLHSGRNTGTVKMREQYQMAFEYLNKNVNGYKYSKLISPFSPKNERSIVRFVLWCIVLLERLGLAGGFFSVYSNLKVDRFWPKL